MRLARSVIGCPAGLRHLAGAAACADVRVRSDDLVWYPPGPDGAKGDADFDHSFEFFARTSGLEFKDKVRDLVELPDAGGSPAPRCSIHGPGSGPVATVLVEPGPGAAGSAVSKKTRKKGGQASRFNNSKRPRPTAAAWGPAGRGGVGSAESGCRSLPGPRHRVRGDPSLPRCLDGTDPGLAGPDA